MPVTPQRPGRRLADEAGNPIVPGQHLGTGGGGSVYTIRDQPRSVVKIWHPDTIPPDAEAKFRYMVNHPVTPGLGASWHITWPEHLVIENGVTVGYTMPILDPERHWESMIQYYNRRAARSTGEAQVRDLRIDDWVKMASNLALGFRAVHEAGYVIGDVNEKNVEVNRQNEIAMVDCDSYGFTDPATGRIFSDGMGRPEFQAPEAEVQGRYPNRTQNHDRFGLGVLIFHLLTGIHPYGLVTNQPDYPNTPDRIKAGLFPPASDGRVTAPDVYNNAWDALTDQQQELFLRCFDQTLQGQPRPTPEEWLEALEDHPDVAPAPSPAATTRPAPSPSPAVASPSPAPTIPAAAPAPRRYYQPPASTSDDWIYWVLAFVGFGALIPLMTFQQFRPWWWLVLTLMAGAFLYLPARRLFSRPITTTRLGLIAVTLVFTAVMLLGLIRAAVTTWPWWLWMAVGMGIAFIFLAPARSVFSSSNVRQRWVAIGGVWLLTIFILGGMAAAGYREWQEWREERRWLEAQNEPGGNAVMAAGGATGGLIPVVAPANTPEPTPTAASAAATPAEPEPVCGQPANFHYGTFNAADRSLVYGWDGPAGGDLIVTGYQTETREAFADGTRADWSRRDALDATTNYETVGPYPSDIDGRTFQNRVYAVCGSVYSQASETITFTYPAAIVAAIPTDTPMPTPTHTPPPTATPIPSPTPAIAPTPAPVLTVLPATANPGETVAVKLTGFPPYTLVHGVSIQGFDILGDHQIYHTDVNGYAFVDNIMVPAIMDSGIYDVSATVGSLSVVVGQLAVVAVPPTPTPPPYPDPVLLAQRGAPPGHLSRAPGVGQYVSGCFVGDQPRQKYWMYLADRPSATLENAQNTILLEFQKTIPREELREVIPGECYYVGPVTYQTDERVSRCPATVYDTACNWDDMHTGSFRLYVTEGTLREITETPQFGSR